MSNNSHQELIKHLKDAHAMERQALLILKRGADLAGDEEIGRIYRAHALQTDEHARYVEERLKAHGESPSSVKDAASQAGALAIGVATQAMPDTPLRLAIAAFAFEHMEIASYRILAELARRAGDEETLNAIGRILEQEEAAAELVAGTFERALQITLGEPPTAPLPPLTPLGKPSERSSEAMEATHEGPQEYKDKGADEPVDQPPDIESPTEGERERLRSPDPGHPVEQTTPSDGEVPAPTHPEPIDDTTPEQQAT
jgi:ferritin-like metal-binding protein YciE